MPRIQIKPLGSRHKRDGYRVLTRSTWPRNLPKEAVDCWVKELAPPVDLLRHHQCGLSPEAFAYVYNCHLRQPYVQNEIKPLALLSLRRRVTLLCGCSNVAFCHDKILVRALERCREERIFSLDLSDCKDLRRMKPAWDG